MTLTEKAAYLKGLSEGLQPDESKPEGKLIAKMLDLLTDMADSIRDLEDECKELRAYAEELDDDLAEEMEVDDAVPAASMQASIEKAAGTILESVKLFDVYKGKGIPEGKKSVAYSLSLRAPDRTLTDEECDKAMKNALAALEKDFGAALRS